MGTYYSGTSGLVIPVANRSMMPQEFQDKSRLTYYASLFNSIEVNSSFYKMHMAATVSRWADSVPGHFRFTFKLWKGITHNKALAFDPDAVKKYMQVVNAAGEKKGCLLIQFPAGLAVNIGQLEKLLWHVNQYNIEPKWNISIEFRNQSWYQKDVYDILDFNKSGIVVHDMHKCASPEVENNTDFAYLRLHGPEKGYRGTYTNEALAQYAETIKGWRKAGKTVYVYFNNTLGEVIKNLRTLNEYVETKP